MENKIIKTLSVFAIAILGAMLSACGNTSADGQTGENDKYAYYATYDKVDFGMKNGYVSASQLSKDELTALTVEYDEETYDVTDMSVIKYNFATKETSKMHLDIEEDGGYITNYKINDDGSVSVILSVYEEKNGFYSEKTFLVVYSSEGKVLSKNDISETIEKYAQGDYLSKVVFDKEVLYIITSRNIIVADYEGKALFNVSIDNWIDSSFLSDDGNLYFRYYSNDGNKVIQYIDLNEKKAKDVNLELPTDGEVLMLSQDEIFCFTNNSVYQYDVNTAEQKLLWNWIDVDISQYYTDNFVSAGNDTYLMIQEEYKGNGDVEFGIVTIKKELKRKSEKKIIKYGCMSLGYDERKRIIDFNRSNPDYRIETVIFSDENHYEEYEANKGKFDMSISKKGELDIIDLSDMDANKYIKAGALEDMSAFLDSDSEISREDLQETVLNALSVDGKLYQITPFYSVNILAGSKEIFGDKTKITTKDLLEARKSHMDIPFILGGSKSSALYMILYGSMGDFVNAAEGTCDFMNQDFYDICEFANTFDEEPDYESYDDFLAIQDKEVAMANLYLSDFQSIEIYKELFGGDMAIFGYPSKNSSGYYLNAWGTLAISSTSKNKDGAWAYIRTLLGEEYQEDNLYQGLSIVKKCFEEALEEEMDISTYIDEDGNVQKEAKGGWGSENVMVYYYGVTKETAAQIREVINNISVSYDVDSQIYDIIETEVGAYFSGQKSIEAVAEIIQNRVRLYLQENS